MWGWILTSQREDIEHAAGECCVSCVLVTDVASTVACVNRAVRVITIIENYKNFIDQQ